MDDLVVNGVSVVFDSVADPVVASSSDENDSVDFSVVDVTANVVTGFNVDVD